MQLVEILDNIGNSRAFLRGRSVLGYKVINTSAVERHNGTSRLRNQRKVRKTLAIPKQRGITAG